MKELNTTVFSPEEFLLTDFQFREEEVAQLKRSIDKSKLYKEQQELFDLYLKKCQELAVLDNCIRKIEKRFPPEINRGMDWIDFNTIIKNCLTQLHNKYKTEVVNA